MDHLTTVDILSALDHVREAPSHLGTVDLIVSRPADDERKVLDDAELSLDDGLVGDNWRTRVGSPDPEAQITVMNSRYIELIARDRDRWQLAGDQLYVDLDLSLDNLPPGTRLRIGSVVIEVSATPHTGCSKFANRFGADALRVANSREGQSLRLRGLNARVLEPGHLKRGETVEKI